MRQHHPPSHPPTLPLAGVRCIVGVACRATTGPENNPPLFPSQLPAPWVLALPAGHGWNQASKRPLGSQAHEGGWRRHTYRRYPAEKHTTTKMCGNGLSPLADGMRDPRHSSHCHPLQSYIGESLGSLGTWRPNDSFHCAPVVSLGSQPAVLLLDLVTLCKMNPGPGPGLL